MVIVYLKMGPKIVRKEYSTKEYCEDFIANYKTFPFDVSSVQAMVLFPFNVLSD